jgi:hypothetical protein
MGAGKHHIRHVSERRQCGLCHLLEHSGGYAVLFVIGAAVVAGLPAIDLVSARSSGGSQSRADMTLRLISKH